MKRSPSLVRAFLLPLASLLLSGTTTQLGAQGTTLAGVVRDATTGLGLESATVSLDRGAHTTVTDPGGRFWIRALKPGRYELRIRYLEQRSKKVLVTIPAHPVVPMEFDLQIQPVPVEELRVTVSREPLSLGRLSGFYERLERGRGDFLTRKELEEISSRRLVDALRKVTSVRVRYCSRGGLTAGSDCLPITIRQCAPTYLWIDGFKIEASRMNDIVQLNTETIEGVEVYSASNVPAQFHPGRFSACTMVIWTRRGTG